MSGEVMYVRLKPHNPKQGFLVKRYYYGDILFTTDHDTERPVWYKINNKKLLEKLSNLRQVDSDPTSKPLLDICTEEEHKQILSREEDLRLVQLGITTPSMVQPVAKAPVNDKTDAKKSDEGRAAAVPEPDIQPSTLGEEPLEEEEPEEEDEPDSDEEEDKAPTEEEAPPKRRARRRRG